jgi:hypothetical protein
MARTRKDLIGSICTVVSPKEQFVTFDGTWVCGYMLDAEPIHGTSGVVIREEWLEPVYDGGEKSSWSECAWKPQTEPVRPVAETK